MLSICAVDSVLEPVLWDHLFCDTVNDLIGEDNNKKLIVAFWLMQYLRGTALSWYTAEINDNNCKA
jgi:hypothetical protein